MRNPLKITKTGVLGAANPTYTPDAIKIPFPNVGDEAKYKQRLMTDTRFAVKRLLKGIHPGEGLIQETLPSLEQTSHKKQNTQHGVGKASLQETDPIQHQANAEHAFAKHQVDNGYQVMNQGHGPQTAAEAQNVSMVQDPTQNGMNTQPYVQTPYPDPFKKREQQIMNPFSMPPGM